MRDETWTAEEIDLLRSDKLSTEELAARLGRSKGAIYQKRERTGILTTYATYWGNVKATLSNDLAELELCYVAGIVDGEGCLSFEVRKRKSGVTVLPFVRVTNTNKELIDYLSERLEYKKLIVHHHKNPAWKDRNDIEVQGFRVAPLLKALLPRLIVKRRQAQLILQFFELRWKDTVMSPVTGEEMQIVAEVRRLNKKGPPTQQS